MQIKKSHKAALDAHSAAIENTINAMLEKAVSRHATDIHLEPRERNIVVRFRIDGLLQEVAKLPLDALDAIAENIKTRAKLAAQESRAPQDGSFVYASDQDEINLQVSTMPTIAGEKIAIHLSTHLSHPANLEALGYWGDMLRRIEYSVAEPHGMVIATSPQRIGTSMSLLGIVQLLNTPALNIVTLEDPIEHRVSGVTQSQVNLDSGINFSNGLQSLLKQDPNVVMISDLHEAEALRIAIDASMRGRLILGGLHVNSASHAIAHLLHMGSEPYLVASSLKLVLAQRFVRRLCPECREEYKPDQQDAKDIRQLLKQSGVTSMKQLHELEQEAAKADIGGDLKSLSTTNTGVARLWRANPNGCPHCKFSGFHGRIGTCETIESSEKLKKVITGKPVVSEIRKTAIADGLLPLQLDGFIKALRGQTPFDEVMLLLNGAW